MSQRINIKIACDLFLDLSLYNIPKKLLKIFYQKFPNCKLVEYNTPTSDNIDFSQIEVYWGNRISKNNIDELKNLKWIHYGSVGINREIVEVVTNRKIQVTNSNDIMTDAVVSTSLAFIFSLARGLHRSIKLKNDKDFTRKSFDNYFNQIQDVIGQTILIAGFGSIGKKLAKICNAIGLKVIVLRQNIEDCPDWVNDMYTINDIDKAVNNCDYIVNLLPLTDKTVGIFCNNIFRIMKKTAFFINVGRGDTVIEDDLIYALNHKIIAGAALDVYSINNYESPYIPLRQNSPLFDLDNIILTPHVAGLSGKYWDKEYKLFADNLERFCNNKKLLNRINMYSLK